jgi:hypothetical protein
VDHSRFRTFVQLCYLFWSLISIDEYEWFSILEYRASYLWLCDLNVRIVIVRAVMPSCPAQMGSPCVPGSDGACDFCGEEVRSNITTNNDTNQHVTPSSPLTPGHTNGISSPSSSPITSLACAAQIGGTCTIENGVCRFCGSEAKLMNHIRGTLYFVTIRFVLVFLNPAKHKNRCHVITTTGRV